MDKRLNIRLNIRLTSAGSGITTLLAGRLARTGICGRGGRPAETERLPLSLRFEGGLPELPPTSTSRCARVARELLSADEIADLEPDLPPFEGGEVLFPLAGDSVPLDTEHGYHVDMAEPPVSRWSARRRAVTGISA